MLLSGDGWTIVERVSLRVRTLPSRGSTVLRKLFLDLIPFLAGSCSYGEDTGVVSLFVFLKLG